MLTPSSPTISLARSFSLAFLTLASVVALLGCGPAIVEHRLGMYPPRDANCTIAVLNGAMQDPSMWAAPSSGYLLVGTIALGERGSVDPFSESHVEIIRPRACKMGGDAISLMMSSQSSAGFGTGTGTAYAVLKKRIVETPVDLTGPSKSL
jgi:hypothetical protein